MKKFLLPGMVAALALAACTNEEIVSQQTVAIPEEDLSNRPLVGMVDLNFGSQTRAALEDGSFNAVEWEAGKDKIGARIIDSYDGTPSWCHHEHDYSITTYASSNYRYDLGEDGKWTSDALMVEGNYMFYAPYNEAAVDRGALKMQFPTFQRVNELKVWAEGNEVNSDAVANFFSNDSLQTIVVGHTFVDANDENPGRVVKPSMGHVYAYPQITLVNTQTVDHDDDPLTEKVGVSLKIDEITLTSANIRRNYTISHSALYEAFRSDLPAREKDLNNDGDTKDGGEKCAAVVYNNWNKSLYALRNGRTVDAADVLGLAAVGQADEDLDGKVVVSLDEAVTIPAGGKVKLHVVLPAEAYALNGLKVNVRMLDEKGKEWQFKSNVVINAVGDGIATDYLTYAPGKRYPQEEYNFYYDAQGNLSDYSTKKSAGALATFQLEGELAEYGEPIIEADKIKNNQELRDWLESIEDNSTALSEITDGQSGQFKLADDHKVVLTKGLMDSITTYLDKGSIRFYSNIPVADGDITVNSRIKGFGALTQAKKAGNKVTLSNATIASFDGQAANFTGVTVSGKATFAGDATVNGGTIEGQATFNKAYLSNTTINSVKEIKGGSINNVDIKTGSLNFKGGETTVFDLKTVTTANITGGAVVTISADITGNNANENGISLTTINVEKGTLNVNKDNWIAYQTTIINLGKDVTPAGALTKSYTDGKLNINGAGTNNIGSVTLTSGEIVANKSVIFGSVFSGNWNRGTVTVAEDVTAEIAQSGLTIPADGKFVNKGTMAYTGGITNNGTIDNYDELIVATNAGTINMLDERAELTVVAGTGVIYNQVLADLEVNAEQTVIYTFSDDVTTNDLVNFDSKKYSINKLVFDEGVLVTIDKDLSTVTTNLEGTGVLYGVTALDFKNGAGLYLKNNSKVRIEEVNISGKVVFEGWGDKLYTLEDVVVGTINIDTDSELVVDDMTLKNVTVEKAPAVENEEGEVTEEAGKLTLKNQGKVEEATVVAGNTTPAN